MGQSTLRLDTPESMFTTGHKCADGDCGEDALAAEAMVLVQVVLPRLNEQQQLYYEHFLNDQQEYAYEPYFFHDGCWANTANALSDLLEELDCLPDQDQYSFGTCGACGGGLWLNEPIGLIELGEFSTATRTPEGHALKFDPYNQAAERYCLSCLRSINEEIIELWEHISFAGECQRCTFEHNWRTGVPCTHQEA